MTGPSVDALVWHEFRVTRDLTWQSMEMNEDDGTIRRSFHNSEDVKVRLCDE